MYVRVGDQRAKIYKNIKSLASHSDVKSVVLKNS